MSGYFFSFFKNKADDKRRNVSNIDVDVTIKLRRGITSKGKVTHSIIRCMTKKTTQLSMMDKFFVT